MATKVSALNLEAFEFDPYNKTSASMTPGTIVKRGASGTVAVCTSASADIPYGLALPNNHLDVFPPNDNIDSGEFVTILKGHGQILITSDGFEAEPSAQGVKLFCSNNGKFTETDGGNQYPVGQYEGKETLADNLGGTIRTYFRVSVHLPSLAR